MNKERKRPTVREVILVEGRYDKNTLAQVVDALILTTEGFGIFKDKEKTALLRRLARERGVVILTDSDGAGLVIRNHLKGILPPEGVRMAYIPDVPGKERRKRSPGKEGKLGVEGMSPEVLLQALERSGATVEAKRPRGEPPFTKAALYALGLSGTAQAAQRRRALQKAMGLPENLSANALLEALNILSTPDEVERLLSEP